MVIGSEMSKVESLLESPRRKGPMPLVGMLTMEIRQSFPVSPGSVPPGETTRVKRAEARLPLMSK